MDQAVRLTKKDSDIMASTPLYKNTSFAALAIGQLFTSPHVVGQVAGAAIDTVYEKISARKARFNDVSKDASGFLVSQSLVCVIEDKVAMARRDREEAKPVFDGTEASCKTQEDFWTLDSALREVVQATTTVDDMATYIARKMSDVQNALRRTGAKETGKTDRFSPKFAIAPVDAVGYCGLNSCGELQGNGNIDMAIATLLAKREAFNSLVNALGYRVK